MAHDVLPLACFGLMTFFLGWLACNKFIAEPAMRGWKNTLDLLNRCNEEWFEIAIALNAGSRISEIQATQNRGDTRDTVH